MTISFYGENCFKIQAGDLTVLTDPIDPKSGLTPPRFKFDILLKTLSPFPPQEKQKDVVVISGPGEYDLKNVIIRGFLSENEITEKILKTIYTAIIEDVKFCFLGHLSDAPTPSIMEHLADIDVMFIPAGGKPFIDQKKAVKLIRQVHPKIAIPTFYRIPGLKRPGDDLKIFIEEFNHHKVEPQEKLTIKKKDLATIKPTQLVVLKI